MAGQNMSTNLESYGTAVGIPDSQDTCDLLRKGPWPIQFNSHRRMSEKDILRKPRSGGSSSTDMTRRCPGIERWLLSRR
jgi:hypothetical protein